MRNFTLVGYAPRTARDWYSSPPRGRGAAEKVARQLLGEGTVWKGRRPPEQLTDEDGQPLLGVMVCGAVTLITWSHMPETSLRWDRLPQDPPRERFMVSSSPASDDLEASWIASTGEVRRRVQISGDQVHVDEGDERLFEEDADDDPTLDVRYGEPRLPARTVRALLAQAAEDEISTYDGRRYVLTRDAGLADAAYIVRPAGRKKWWVAVDQSGPVNTLRDPLARPLQTDDLDALAERIANAWFRDNQTFGYDAFSWPDGPADHGLAHALATVRGAQREFFDILADARDDDQLRRSLEDRFGLSSHDVHLLLTHPLGAILPAAE